jgi:hypothetical protein
LKDFSCGVNHPVFNTACHPDNAMFLNFEIDEETGALLDAIAKAEDRSKRAQAARLLRDAVRMVASDKLIEVQMSEEGEEQ